MNTVTIPKQKYKLLERQAVLLRNFLKDEAGFPIEKYSTERLAGFLKEDRIDRSIRDKAKRMLKRKA